MRRILYVNHWLDRYEVLVDGMTILRVHKLFHDSGMIRPVTFDELPESIQDLIVREMERTMNRVSNYEI